MALSEPVGTGAIPTTQSQAQLLFRGQEYNFDTIFTDGNEVVIPADPTLYPTFVLLTPSGSVATSGIGTNLGNGKWRARWVVPADADTGEWRIQWTMYSTRQRTYQHELRFTVREQNEPMELLADIPAFVVMEGTQGERVSLLTDIEYPIDLKLAIHESNACTAYSHELLRYDAARLQHENVGVKTLWWAELPAFASGEWMLFWSFRRSPAGPTERIVKELFVPPAIFWELYQPLDSFLDRIQKDQHQPFGYYEDDMYRYLKRGLQLLNQLNPVTTWQLYTLPRGWGLEDWLIRAAGYWAFQDRTIVGGEMQFCVTGDTLVPTPSGLRTIRSLVGDVAEEQQVPKSMSLLTPDGAQTTLFVYKSEVIPVTRLVTKSGYEVSGRRTHPVLTLTPTMKLKWVHITDLQPGDVVAVDRQLRDAKSVSLRRIAEQVRSERQQKQASHNGGSVGSEREYNLPTILTKPLARLLGYLTAEGAVNAESGRMTFTNTDRQLLRDFQRCWEQCFGFAPKITPTNNHLRDDTSGVNPGYVIDVCSVQVRRYLEKLGLGRDTAHTKRLPWCIRRAPLAVARHFMQAYFDGDGCVKPDDYSGSMYSASLELLKDVQQLLLRFGCITQLHSQPDKAHELAVRGPSWDRYAELIGFFSHKNRNRYRAPQTRTPQIESIPGLRQAIEAATIEVTQNHGWFNGEQLKVSWMLVDKNHSEHTTYEHLHEYLTTCGADLQKCAPTLRQRLEVLEHYNFHWEVVELVERDYKQARTYDVGLPETDSPLAHAFATNGIVSHNSLGAQDITLDVERQQFYQQQAQDLWNQLTQFAGKSKREVLRHLRSPARLGLRLGTGVSATLGGADLLGGITSPWLRGFSRARRRGGGY